MLLREEDTEVFKGWLLPKLETISDADAEVLADYVIALVTTNEPEASIRRNCLDSLADFLQDNTPSFVGDVIKALKSKSYASRAPVKGPKSQSSPSQQQTQASQASQAPPAGPIPSIVGNSTNAEYEPHPFHSSNTAPLHAPKGPASTRPPKAQHRLPDRPTGPSPSQSYSPSLNIEQDRSRGSKKRKQVQRDTSEARDGQDSHYNHDGPGNRPTKQPARRTGKNAMGGKNLHGGAVPFEPQNTFPGFASMSSMPNMLNIANLPPPPPGPMPFDVNNPMAFFAMMAALGTTMPGMPPLPAIKPNGNVADNHVWRGKCSDYHTKGFCALGALCSLEHGETDDTNEIVPEYDPTQPSLSMGRTPPYQVRQGSKRNHHSNAKGGKPRANFSLPGPTSDRTITTIVVEQIPKEHFTEDNVRSYFSQFGPIVELEMYPHRRLATIKFEDHSAASRAYNSPKAVFENRFVKVYWMRPDTVLEGPKRNFGDVDLADAEDESFVSEEVMSLEEIAKRQAEAQKAFEERRRKFEEAEARAADIDRQLKEKDAEMREIKRQLAELAGEDFDEADEAAEQLATLQAEAAKLFETSEASAAASRGHSYHPHGTYRGRGFAPFSLRGRGALRGAYRGRGAYTTHFTRIKSGVKRLDNRPRRIAIAGIEKGTPKDEALRQYLVGLPECTSIESHPEQPNTVILTFQERYQAESFIDKSRYIPDTGPLELSWVPNDAFGGLKASTTTTDAIHDVEVDADASDDDDSSATIGEPDDMKQDSEDEDHGHQADADMDVADDVDQWL